MKTLAILLVTLLTSSGCQHRDSPMSTESALGFQKYQSGEFTNAYMSFLSASKYGDAFAYYMLGLCYEKGHGIPQDRKRAVELYREAASRDYSYAWRALGVCYRDGIGVEQNYNEAIRCFRKAADLGVNLAITEIGALYLEGLGVSQDTNRALSLYRKAAAKGEVHAHLNLGELYYFGKVLPPDKDAAVWHFRKAADGGLVNAMIWLVSLHDSGITDSLDAGAIAGWKESISLHGVSDVAEQLTLALRSGDEAKIEGARKDAAQSCYSFAVVD